MALNLYTVLINSYIEPPKTVAPGSQFTRLLKQVRE
jgi:hypothetical protein